MWKTDFCTTKPSPCEAAGPEPTPRPTACFAMFRAFVASSSPSGIEDRVYLAYALVVVYVSISLLPLLYSGYYSDDLINSSLKGHLELQNISFFQYLIDVNRYWISSNGRFFPVCLFTTFGISYFAYHLQLYKIFILSNIIVNVLLSGYLLHIVTRNRYVSYLAMLTLPILFQFRLYHDPILSFSAMMQLFLSFILWALILLHRHLHQKSAWYLVASVAFYNLALYFYEVSLLLLPLFLILVIAKHHARISDMIKVSISYVMSATLALIVMIVVRQMRDVASAGYSGITLNLEASRVYKTFLLQLCASLPLTYYIGNPSQLFRHDVSSLLGEIAWYDLLVLALFISFYLTLINKVVGARSIPILFYLGSTLMICPAVLISMSLKYQAELRYFGAGMGYVPVYIQYFGTAFVMTAGIVLTLQKLRSKGKRMLVHIAVLVLISAALLVNMQSNRLVVEKANIDLHYRRAALTQALGENILRDVPDNAKLYILDEYTFDPYPFVDSHLKGWAASGYPWKSDGLVYLYAKRRVQVINDVTGLFISARDDNATHAGVKEMYVLRIKSYPDKMGIKEGYVELSRIQNVHMDKDGNVQFESSPLRSSRLPNI